MNTNNRGRSMTEILGAAGHGLNPIPLPETRQRPVDSIVPPQTTILSKNPLPEPDHYQAYAWKVAWFIRAMRTEDLRDMSTDMLALMPTQNMATPADVMNWLIAWSRREHGVVENGPLPANN